MNLIQKIILSHKIRTNKQRAKELRLKITQVMEDWDCGIYLARSMHPDLEDWEREYKFLMGWLKNNDPKFPKDMK